MIVLVQLLLTLGLALLVSALTVHFRDLKDLLANLLTLWFFATPIIYPMPQAPETVPRLLNLNPMTHLAISYQEVLFYAARSGTGSGCWRCWRRVAGRCSSSATSCSIGCATRSRRKCDGRRWLNAIDAVNVTRSTAATRARSSSRR